MVIDLEAIELNDNFFVGEMPRIGHLREQRPFLQNRRDLQPEMLQPGRNQIDVRNGCRSTR